MNLEDLEILFIEFDACVLFPLKVRYRRFKRHDKKMLILLFMIIVLVIIYLICFIK